MDPSLLQELPHIPSEQRAEGSANEGNVGVLTAGKEPT